MLWNPHNAYGGVGLAEADERSEERSSACF
jgi:hypothetical protein